MSDRVRTPDEQLKVFRYAALAGPARGLDLFRRVPELLRSRGWSTHPDLQAVLISAIGLTKIGAGATVIKRPPGADEVGGKWPVEAGKLTARQIVVELELKDLLQAV